MTSLKWLRIRRRRETLRLKSRHLLLILDCCFGGAMAHDFFRGGGEGDRPIYYSEYKRFVEGTAWQLLSSASFDQQALDRDPDFDEALYNAASVASALGRWDLALELQGRDRGAVGRSGLPTYLFQLGFETAGWTVAEQVLADVDWLYQKFGFQESSVSTAMVYRGHRQ